MVDNESVDRICSQIVEDGEKEIRSTLDKARETASGIVGKAEAEARRISERILKEAAEKGELARRRLLSSVSLEVRRAKLRAREEVVSVVYGTVEKTLAAQRGRDGYAGILEGLIVEAVESLDGDAFVVSVDRRDLPLLEGTVVAAVRKRMERSGRTIRRIEGRALEKSSLGGARIGVGGRNVVYDNTFEARMYRLRDEIRHIIFEEVFPPREREE